MVKKILLILLGILAGLVAAEFLMRLIKPAPTIYPISVTADNGDHALSMNRKLIYVPKPNTGEFNAKGYRGKEFSYDRVPGKKRLVFMGDSVLEGLGVKAEERFTDLLMSRLGDNYEIINLGVRGYNLAQEFEYFKEFGLRYKPDAVLFCVTFNDLDIDAGEIHWLKDILEKQGKDAFFKAFYQKKSKLHEILLKSHIYRYLYLIASGGKKKPKESGKDFFQSVYYRLTDDEINGILDAIIALGQKNRCTPAFVVMPMPTRAKYLVALREMVRAKNIRVIDLFEFARKNYSDQDRHKLFLDFCHLNLYGHRIMADVLAGEIVPLIR